MDKNLVDWYSSYLISKKDKLQSISRTVVADAFFSKETFITPMCENKFHVISRFQNDVSCTIRHWNRKQENVVIPSGLTAGLTLPIWI